MNSVLNCTGTEPAVGGVASNRKLGMVFENLRDEAWLRDKGDNVWWNHTGRKQALYGRSVTSVQNIKISRAPGWSSLLPQTANGVDAGLQCPMCTTSKGQGSL